MTRMLLWAALAAFSSSAWAEGMTLTPGKWEMNSTVELQMMGEPHTVTNTQCFTQSEFTPESFNQLPLPNDCTFAVQEISSSSMSWTMDCATPGGNSTGTFNAVSSGSELNGDGIVTMNVAGQSLETTLTWTGERIGDC